MMKRFEIARSMVRAPSPRARSAGHAVSMVCRAPGRARGPEATPVRVHRWAAGALLMAMLGLGWAGPGRAPGPTVRF